MGVLVNDHYNIANIPRKMFDGDTATYYHNGWGTVDLPGVKVYFGYEVAVSRVKITNRLNHQPYLQKLESTVVSVMTEGGVADFECGILGLDNAVSEAAEYKIYNILCGNVKGIGLSVQRPVNCNGWCISELEIYHFTGTVH